MFLELVGIIVLFRLLFFIIIGVELDNYLEFDYDWLK